MSWSKQEMLIFQFYLTLLYQLGYHDELYLCSNFTSMSVATIQLGGRCSSIYYFFLFVLIERIFKYASSLYGSGNMTDSQQYNLGRQAFWCYVYAVAL